MAMQLENWVSRDETVSGGKTVFRGTQVPVAILFDHLQDGRRLEEILDAYPAIPADAAAAVLSYALKHIMLETGELSAEDLLK